MACRYLPRANAEIFGIRTCEEGHSRSLQKTVRLHHSDVTWPSLRPKRRVRMNCTFFSVVSTSLSIASGLAQTCTLERIVAISSGRVQRRPGTPASASSHCWNSFDTDQKRIRCNDGRNIFGAQADGAATLMVRTKITRQHDCAHRTLRSRSTSLGANFPIPAAGRAVTLAHWRSMR